jgi:hypothetical protein
MTAARVDTVAELRAMRSARDEAQAAFSAIPDNEGPAHEAALDVLVVARMAYEDCAERAIPALLDAVEASRAWLAAADDYATLSDENEDGGGKSPAKLLAAGNDCDATLVRLRAALASLAPKAPTP